MCSKRVYLLVCFLCEQSTARKYTAILTLTLTCSSLEQRIDVDDEMIMIVSKFDMKKTTGEGEGHKMSLRGRGLRTRVLL